MRLYVPPLLIYNNSQFIVQNTVNSLVQYTVTHSINNMTAVMQRVTLKTNLTSSVFVTQVGEPPHICQVHGKAYDRKQKVQFLAPCLPVFLIRGSGGAAAGARRGHYRGIRVLDAVLLLHQDQLHFLLLHV